MNSVNEYLELTAKVEAKWNFTNDDVGRAWYRGQQRRHWRLVPNIVRQRCFDRETEDEIREEFAVRAPGVPASECAARSLCGSFLCSPARRRRALQLRHPRLDIFDLDRLGGVIQYGLGCPHPSGGRCILVQHHL